MKLTKAIIDQAVFEGENKAGPGEPPKWTRSILWDDGISGLGLRIFPSGLKTFVLSYRAGGRKRLMSLGRYGTLTVAQARAKALKVLASVVDGEDPLRARIEQRQRDQEAKTVGELARLYIERYAKPKKKTWKQDEYRFKADVLPYWRHRRIEEITRADVTALLDRIVDRGSPYQANRVRALLSKLFNFAISRGLTEVNPAQLVEAPAPESRRERVLAPEEIRALWQVLEEDGSLMARSFELRILTGQRSGEVMRMRWEDLDGDWWTLSGDLTKNGQPHAVFLSPQARAILDRLRSHAIDSPWVFPNPRDVSEPMTNWGKALPRFRQAAGIAHFTAHDLRRTAGTGMAELGVPRLVVGKVLNHLSVDHGVTAIYDRHDYREEKKQALLRWGQRVEEIVSGEEGEVEAAKIVALHR